MSNKTDTVETYNKSASALADKFNSLGARIEDIKYVFSFIKKNNPFVVEIGCGNGRDAKEINTLTNKYLGIDISENLIEIAQKDLPNTKFIIADVEHFDFPQHIDVVFAFASLIHVQKESFKKILEDVYQKLEKGGFVFISLKHSDKYKEVTKADEFGIRTYWHYSENDIKEISSGFTIFNLKIHELREQKWMDILLTKE